MRGKKEDHERHKHDHHHHVILTPATGLTQIFIKHHRRYDMETYKLSWTPGSGASQELHTTVAGQAEVITPTPDGTTSSANVDFVTDASVSWFVRTFNADKSQFVDSQASVFVASNQSASAVTPATNLTQTWVSHQP